MVKSLATATPESTGYPIRAYSPGDGSLRFVRERPPLNVEERRRFGENAKIAAAENVAVTDLTADFIKETLGRYENVRDWRIGDMFGEPVLFRDIHRVDHNKVHIQGAGERQYFVASGGNDLTLMADYEGGDPMEDKRHGDSVLFFLKHEDADWMKSAVVVEKWLQASPQQAPPTNAAGTAAAAANDPSP